MKKLSDLFYIYTGSKLDFGKQVLRDDGINFVSRNSNNNGVVGKVELQEGMKVYKKGDITVPLGGSYLLSAFVQDEDFVTAQNVDVLRPIKPMTDIEKWFYCYILRENRFKFSAFGREVNKYIQDIEVPDEIPDWIYSMEIRIPETKNSGNNYELIDTLNWEYFEIPKLFKVRAGFYHYSDEYSEGHTPYISATNKNNGINDYIDIIPEFESNRITTEKVNCCAFYQPNPFCATSDVNVFEPLFEMNKYIALFIVTIINYDENYRWNYGRQCRVGDSNKIRIKLPIKKDSNGVAIIDKNKKYSKEGYIPDWEYMENFIKSFPFAEYI